MSKTLFLSPLDQTELDLRRYPFRPEDQLQAWDSADDLILQQVAGLAEGGLLAGKRILVVQDSFGAITSALVKSVTQSKAGYENMSITAYSDSAVSAKATGLNLRRLNAANQGAVFADQRFQEVSSLSELSGRYDFIFSRVPKNMSFYEDLLCRMSQHVTAESQFIFTAMVKHLPKTAFELLNKWIGTTTTSLEKKKARLIFAKFEKTASVSPYPLSVAIEDFEKPFTHHSNLFSREKLDIGTRFFLENLPAGNFETILDLGCANGIVGIAAKMKNPQAKIIFCDESKMAIESARLNYAQFFGDEAEFLWMNCYENRPKASVDLVLCNPPFHQENIVGDFIAHQMFVDARNVLKKGGHLRIVGNAHLPYPGLLKKIFGNSKVVATNAKFMIVDSTIALT